MQSISHSQILNLSRYPEKPAPNSRNTIRPWISPYQRMNTNSSAPIAGPHPTLQLLLLRATESLEFPIFIHTRKDPRENEESSLITTLYHQTPISPPKTQAKYIQPQLRSLTAPLLPCNVTLLSQLSLLALSMRLFRFFTNPFLVYYFSIFLLSISLELSYSCPPVSPYPKQ